MPKYIEIVNYIKDNHISWNNDVFDILKGFFGSQSQQYFPSPTPTPPSPVQQELVFPNEDFKEPQNGEYTTQDLIKLFSL